MESNKSKTQHKRNTQETTEQTEQRALEKNVGRHTDSRGVCKQRRQLRPSCINICVCQRTYRPLMALHLTALLISHRLGHREPWMWVRGDKASHDHWHSLVCAVNGSFPPFTALPSIHFLLYCHVTISTKLGFVHDYMPTFISVSLLIICNSFFYYRKKMRAC